MQTLTGSTAINAAFLQEIKDDNHELRQLLADATALLLPGRLIHIEPRALADVLTKLRDRLAMHFSLEEAFGYFDDAVSIAPRLSKRADTLRCEHRQLFVEFCALVEAAERLLYHEAPRRGARLISDAFAAFHARLRRHEQAEGELIMQAFVDDIGVGD
jgi:hypothetical protein